MPKSSQRVLFGLHSAPPHKDHQRIVGVLLGYNKYELVSIVLTGVRKDKREFCEPQDRLNMAQFTFSPEWMQQCDTPCVIDTQDVFKENTPTIELLEREQTAYPNQEIIFVIGMDLVAPRKEYAGECEIQRSWVRGRELYKNFNFIVIPRKGFAPPPGRLPENFSMLDVHPHTKDFGVGVELEGISSDDIRRRVQHGLPFEHLVTHEVGEYIRAHRLFKT